MNARECFYCKLRLKCFWGVHAHKLLELKNSTVPDSQCAMTNKGRLVEWHGGGKQIAINK